MRPRRQNVAVIVAAALVAVTTIVLATFTAMSHLSHREREMDRLRRDLAAEADELAVSLALPVWNIDRAQIDKIVDGIAVVPDVYGVVVDAAGKTHARMRDGQWRFVPANGHTAPAQAGLLSAERRIAFAGEPIGTVRLFASRRFVDDTMRRSLWSMIAAIVLVDLLLTLTVYAILWRTVLRPLGAVEQYAQTVSAAGVENVSMPLAPGAANEFLSLRSSIQSMVQLLAQRYGALQRESAARVASEERFGTIFDSVHDAIMIRDLETGAILDVNQATFAMFGFAPADLPTLHRLRSAADGESQVFEWEAQRKDGSRFWTEVSLSAAVLGGKRRAIVVVRDISQRKQMEDALRDALDFTGTAINALAGLFFVMTREGRVIRRNDTLDRLIGAQHGMPPLSLVHRDDQAKARRAILEVFERGTAEVEVRVRVESEFRDFLINGRRMDLAGDSFVVGSGIDITERRRAEAEELRLRNELARSAMEWHQTFDTVRTPILITDRECHVRRVNRAALELSGLSEEELLGRTVDEIRAGEPWTTATRLVSSIQPGDSLATAETKDEQGRTWNLSISHFATTADRADRFILVLWEITGIVDLQESLRRSETLSAMGTLVAGVAHEVRNPLFGISAALDAYERELSHPDFEGFGPTLRREVRRLTELMQELLEYGKPSVPALAHGSVRAVVDAAIAGRLSTARASGVQLENLIAHGEPALLIDRSRLQQVFENLIDNAVQHSPAGGHVVIRSKPVEQGGRRWIEVLVEDEGRGFPVKDLDRVFQPFFTARYGGTGLGLSIVQRIVQEHSGKVSAGNRPDGGAVVTILLPDADAQAAAKVVA